MPSNHFNPTTSDFRLLHNLILIPLTAQKPFKALQSPSKPFKALRFLSRSPEMAFRPPSFTRALLLCVLLLSTQSTHITARNIRGPIKTVVVLVMENRSFDHILGWLKSTRPEIDGLTGSESNRLSVTDPKSPEVHVSSDAFFIDSDPGHSFQAIREQIFGSNQSAGNPALMNGFAQQAQTMSPGMAATVMSGFKPEVLPVYTELANEFAVFDRWFASVPASTQPNRFYVHSATSHGATSNVRKDLIHGFPQRTIFDSLDENDLSFGIYYQNIPATLFFKSLRKLKHVTKFHSYSLKFKRHAKLGKLPNYAVIEQRYFDVKELPANDDHPSHDVARGQRFVKEVYETLRASPQWKETALLITYDEHGGFYDHVPTPISGVPNPDGIIGPDPFYFRFDRLGVRVPTILVSPWVEKATGQSLCFCLLGLFINFVLQHNVAYSSRVKVVPVCWIVLGYMSLQFLVVRPCFFFYVIFVVCFKF